MAVGVLVALLGTRPVPLILLAQVLNGLVLPVVAVVLLVAMNDRRRLAGQVNRWWANLLGVTVVGLCLVLGVRALVGAF
jgi:Mn2+/Fe2+ NRAMP family transporter